MQLLNGLICRHDAILSDTFESFAKSFIFNIGHKNEATFQSIVADSFFRQNVRIILKRKQECQPERFCDLINLVTKEEIRSRRRCTTAK